LTENETIIKITSEEMEYILFDWLKLHTRRKVLKKEVEFDKLKD
jgi:hypothetical protein